MKKVGSVWTTRVRVKLLSISTSEAKVGLSVVFSCTFSIPMWIHVIIFCINPELFFNIGSMTFHESLLANFFHAWKNSTWSNMIKALEIWKMMHQCTNKLYVKYNLHIFSKKKQFNLHNMQGLLHSSCFQNIKRELIIHSVLGCHISTATYWD